MISVSICINGNPIFARSARNQARQVGGKTVYVTDSGEKIYHKRDDGAIVLAKMMLDTIKEDMKEEVNNDEQTN